MGRWKESTGFVMSPEDLHKHNREELKSFVKSIAFSRCRSPCRSVTFLCCRAITRTLHFDHSFPLQLESGQTVECTVAKYFHERYKMRLQWDDLFHKLFPLLVVLIHLLAFFDNRYPHLPCLQVGQEQKHTYLPLEVPFFFMFILSFC